MKISKRAIDITDIITTEELCRLAEIRNPHTNHRRIDYSDTPGMLLQERILQTNLEILAELRELNKKMNTNRKM